MKKEEFVESIFFNGKLVNVGLDDAGQSYFIEYVDEHGDLNEESVGSYNTDYKGYIEYTLGTPDLCEKNQEICWGQNLSKNNVPQKCPHPHKYGYCDKCPYQDYEWYVRCQLRNLGVIDRHGDVLNPEFKKLFEESFLDSKNKN